VELNYINKKYYSNWEYVGCGVPQGSLLFNIYINDFPLEISKISEVMFADDTSILRTAKDYYNLKSKLDVVFSHLFKRFQNNQLVLNMDKTKTIKFTPTAATSYPLDIVFFNKTLKEVEMIEFLGFQLDNHLTCKGHIDYLLHKLSTVGFLMSKLSYILTLCRPAI
jgi:hypothetical protein